MPDCRRSSIAADALDRLVLDVIELERLAREIAAALEGIGPGTCPNLPIATQLLELFYRAQEAGVAIDTAARSRIRTLIAGLEPDDPARRLGEQEIARLERLGVTGEIRGEGFQDGQRALPSLEG
jgi:hypothetical protein